MPLVRVRILQGKTQLSAPTRPFAAEASVQIVVDEALKKAPDGFKLQSLDAYPNAKEEPMMRSELDLDFLDKMTLAELQSSDIGFFWCAHGTTARTGPPTTPSFSSSSSTFASAGGAASAGGSSSSATLPNSCLSLSVFRLGVRSLRPGCPLRPLHPLRT